MLVIRDRNVNTIWKRAVDTMLRVGVRSESRAGPVLVAPFPCLSIYVNPTERVLFDPARDANPFFHLFESLWMLAGRRDAAWLNQFIGDYSERFAEPDGNIHDAYGFRWRHQFGYDQLAECVEKLRKDPTDRQAVITMWDPDCCGSDDLTAVGLKTRPCNTHIYLRVRDNVLDLTVTCRSNDIAWGAYGANAVHFSILQEYLAARIGVGVGVMYQWSNNWHVYESFLQPYLDRRDDRSDAHVDPYQAGYVAPRPMVGNPDCFDRDLERFMTWTGSAEPDQEPGHYQENPWFHETAEPLYVAHRFWKAGDRDHALEVVSDEVHPIASDWRTACQHWMQHRQKAKVEAVP
jgi:hypothetical protein